MEKNTSFAGITSIITNNNKNNSNISNIFSDYIQTNTNNYSMDIGKVFND